MNWKSIKRYLSTPAILVSLVILLILIIGLIWFLASRGGDEAPATAPNSNYKPSNELSSKEYQEYTKEFAKLVVEQNPGVALDALNELTKTEQDLSRSCYDMTVRIGRQAYVKYKDYAEAVSYQKNLCNSGYLHGVIEAYLFASQDVENDGLRVCLPYQEGKYLSWECYHGVGHGWMLATKNDLPRSLSMCEKLTTNFSKSACVNGVFMENFTVYQKASPSKYLKSDNPFYPCKEQKTAYKADCYVYAPTYYLNLNENKYTNAMKWCEDAEQNYQTVCAQGVGSQVMKDNINNYGFAESICASGKAEFAQPCIKGLSSLFLFYNGDLQAAQDLCTKLAEQNKKTCNDTVAGYAFLFKP